MCLVLFTTMFQSPIGTQKIQQIVNEPILVLRFQSPIGTQKMWGRGGKVAKGCGVSIPYRYTKNSGSSEGAV